jgi:hypothetical protein
MFTYQVAIKKKGEVDQSMCPSDEKGLETNVYLLRTEN